MSTFNSFPTEDEMNRAIDAFLKENPKKSSKSSKVISSAPAPAPAEDPTVEELEKTLSAGLLTMVKPFEKMTSPEKYEQKLRRLKEEHDEARVNSTQQRLTKQFAKTSLNELDSVSDDLNRKITLDGFNDKDTTQLATELQIIHELILKHEDNNL
jgi:hypothetical protein